jgi:hypothetical protein
MVFVKRGTLLLALLCCFFAIQCSAQSQELVSKMDNMKSIFLLYRDQWRELRAGSNATNLASIKEFVEGIDERWRQENLDYYASLMIEVCRALGSTYESTTQVRQFEQYMRQYAMKALEKPDEISIFIESDLTTFLRVNTEDSAKTKREAFARERTENTAMRLHCWRRWQDTLDPNWSASNSVTKYAAMPLGTFTISGDLMDPRSITDPVLKKKYEDALEYNNKIRKIDDEQRDLRKRTHDLTILKNYIIGAYSQAPYDTEELSTLLIKYGINKEEADKLLNAVKAQIKEKENK